MSASSDRPSPAPSPPVDSPSPPVDSPSPPVDSYPRPGLRVARSFSRLESLDGELDPLASSLSRLVAQPLFPPDIHHESSEDEDGNPISDALMPEGFDVLPPELITLADRFIDSLTKPIHPAPLTVTQLSDLFQQFYGNASHAIGKYVSQSYLSLSSKKSHARTPTTQMLSKAQIHQKKRDRKLLEVRRVALEEAIERRVTEGLYDKLWRHKSTDDEARDESLQSKIAALKVVGVSLEHLGVELDSTETVSMVDVELQDAVRALTEMNEKQYPLGKLGHLKQAHKLIVECLTKHTSVTSADSLLPTLIYTLILSPPEPALNAISNLYFTQRFRASNFIDGEAAYCLTNLEAAISFLETVDLATLKITDWAPPILHNSSSSEIDTPLLVEESDKPRSMRVSESTALPPVLSSSLAPPAPPTVPVPIPSAYPTPWSAAAAGLDPLKHIGFSIGRFARANYPTLGALQRTENSGAAMPPPPQESGKPHSIISPVPSPPPSIGSPVAWSAASAAAAHLDPLKHLSTSLGRFANLGRGFARTAAAAVHTPAVPAAAPEVQGLLETFPELARELPPVIEDQRMPPAIEDQRVPLEYMVNERFLGLEDVAELRVGEVEALLREYQGLVGVLKKAGLVG